MFSLSALERRPPFRPRSLAAVVVAVALFSAACSSDGEQVSTSPAADAGSASAEGSAAGSEGTAEETDAVETETEPDTGPKLDPSTFVGEATTVDGEPYDLAVLADKDLVLWFWAPW